MELGIQLKESGIPTMLGIQNPCSIDKGWNPTPGIWNLRCGIQNPRLSWIHGESESIILQETDQVVEDFSLDYGNQEITLNNKTGNSNLPATQFNNKESCESVAKHLNPA